MTGSSLSVLTTMMWTLCVHHLIILNVIPSISALDGLIPHGGLWENLGPYGLTYKREHSLLKPYWGHGWMIPHWDFFGNTVITSDYVRLTSDSKSQAGGIWNKVPVEIPDWEVLIQIHIHGKGSSLVGDGLAFWYSKDRMENGPVFGSKDRFMGLGVMIDTYGNQNIMDHQYPYVSIMVNNGSLHYDHDGDGTLTQIGGCEAVHVRKVKERAGFMVRYVNNVLTVFTDFDETDYWTVCARIDGVKLPTKYYFGMTAATGDLSDNHDVIGFHATEISANDGGLSEEELAERQLIIPSVIPGDPSLVKFEELIRKNGFHLWSWIGAIFWYLGFMAVVGGVGFTGFTIYRNYKRQSKKRFY